MDTSVRLYNSNSRLRSPLGTETRSYSTSPLQGEEDRSGEISGDEGERVTDSISSQSISVLEEPAQRVDVADFEAIFQRFQGPITNFISDSGGAASENFTSNNEDGEGRSVSSFHERGGYDGGRFENRVADREIVERILKQLPPKYAVCLWLYENDGHSCAEIADMLNISASAVKMRLMRARERFITLYQQEVGDK